jgi:hypothetical protein
MRPGRPSHALCRGVTGHFAGESLSDLPWQSHWRIAGAGRTIRRSPSAVVPWVRAVARLRDPSRSPAS